MPIKDIQDIYQEYKDINNYRAFLYTPSDIFYGEIELVKPRLSLNKLGFDLLEFDISSKVFDILQAENINNPMIDKALDGYYIDFWFGDLGGNYQKRKFILKNRNSVLSEEKPVFSYIGISAEYELQKLPIPKWPGIQIKEYKDISRIITSVEQVGDSASATLLDDASGDYVPISLRAVPKDGKIIVTRVHTEYLVEIPLFKTEVAANDLENMPENEFYYDSANNQVIAWLPAHLSLPTDEFGTISWNDPVDSYQYYIYYESESPATITTGEFEESFFYSSDGLTINEIVEDLFNNLTAEESSLQYFLNWTYNKNNSFQSSEIRSGLNFSNTNVYDILKSLAENYQVYIEYDTINRVITIKEKYFGINNGLRFEYGKYIKGITQNYNTDNLINYVQGQDANQIGFTDVSWSGDNYIENYDYYLDGAVWDGSEVVGSSRWISPDLTEELSKIKYYQDQFHDEVWGNDSGTEGIANIRYKLQELIVDKQFELEEIEAEIYLNEGLLDAYEAADDTRKAVLDKGAKGSTQNVVTNVIVPGEVHTIGIDERITKSNRGFVQNLTNIKNGDSLSFDSFRIVGSVVLDVVDKITQYASGVLNRIVVSFYNNGILVKTIYVDFTQMNKLIPLNQQIIATQVTISASVDQRAIEMFNLKPSFYFRALTIFEPETTEKNYLWDNYEKFINAKLLNLQAQKTQKEIEIGLINNGPSYSSTYDGSSALAENDQYDDSTKEGFGIAQIEIRMDYIRNFTSIDHENLEANAPQVLAELKAIRKGGIYSNNDIRNSKTLFVAAKDYLEEKIYPEITVEISSVSILQTYEGYEDWDKVKIGEKVDIYVPDLKVNIEAEIQQMNIDFQNYSMSLVISTVNNYDKSFGKIFSDIRKLSITTWEQEVQPTIKNTRAVIDIYSDTEKQLEALSNNTPTVIGVGTADSGVINTNKVIASNQFVDLATDRLTPDRPVYYPETASTRAEIGNGGFAIKGENKKSIIKMSGESGIQAYNTNDEEVFGVDLDGSVRGNNVELTNGSLSIGQTTRDFDEDGIFLGFFNDAPVLSIKNQTEDTFITWDDSAQLNIKGSLFADFADIDSGSFSGEVVSAQTLNVIGTGSRAGFGSSFTYEDTSLNASKSGTGALFNFGGNTRYSSTINLGYFESDPPEEVTQVTLTFSGTNITNTVYIDVYYRINDDDKEDWFTNNSAIEVNQYKQEIITNIPFESEGNNIKLVFEITTNEITTNLPEFSTINISAEALYGTLEQEISITNLVEPTNDSDAATKKYVDDSIFTGPTGGNLTAKLRANRSSSGPVSITVSNGLNSVMVFMFSATGTRVPTLVARLNEISTSASANKLYQGSSEVAAFSRSGSTQIIINSMSTGNFYIYELVVE